MEPAEFKQQAQIANNLREKTREYIQQTFKQICEKGNVDVNKAKEVVSEELVDEIVELSDGSAGLVLEQNPNNLLQPKVLILRSAKGERLRKARIMNPQDWEGRGLWIAKGHEHGAFGIDPMAYFN